MQWMLAIDTCGATGGVALVELIATHPGFRIVAELILPGRETQEQLMLSIAAVLASESLAPQDLNVLAAVSGPGSFTGVRIGLAAVKGLSEALNLPVVAVSRLAVLASMARSTSTIEAWIDAGRGEVFAGRYAVSLSLGEAILAGSAATALHIASEPLLVMEEPLAARIAYATLVPPVGVSDAVPLFVEKVTAGDFDDIALLDANYLRVPDAELARLRSLATA